MDGGSVARSTRGWISVRTTRLPSYHLAVPAQDGGDVEDEVFGSLLGSPPRAPGGRTLSVRLSGLLT